MLRNPLVLALVASLATLLTSARVQAWGGAHAGYTYVSPDGVYNVGRSLTSSPYGGTYDNGNSLGTTTHYGSGPGNSAPWIQGYRYGAPNYPYYGGFLDGGSYAAGLRTGVWGPVP